MFLSYSKSMNSIFSHSFFSQARDFNSVGSDQYVLILKELASLILRPCYSSGSGAMDNADDGPDQSIMEKHLDNDAHT
jgi:hypothetical protein